MKSQSELETQWTLYFDTLKDAETARKIADKFDDLSYSEITEDVDCSDGIEMVKQVRLDIWYHDKYAQ